MTNFKNASRADEYTSKQSNPCTKFLSWDQNAKSFTYWDKEKAEDVVVDLPMRFIKLKELSTVKGWHNDSNSGIFSNEVVNLQTDELNVRAFKGGDIVKGTYANIKDTIIKNGGHYEKSIYVLDGTGELLNIALKGSGIHAYSVFMEDKGRKRALTEWIVIEQAIDAKKGAISYTVPSFDYLKEISSEETEEADTKYRAFMEYFNSYAPKPVVETNEEDVND